MGARRYGTWEPRNPVSLRQNWPHLLSLVRIPMAAAVWIAPANVPLLFTWMALAALSDWLDGWAARRLRERLAGEGVPDEELERQAHVGAWLDPLCDKIFVASVAVAVWAVHRPEVLVVLLVALREILLAPLLVIFRLVPRLWERRKDFTARWPGKLTTVLQFVAVGLIVVDHPWVFPLAVVTGAMGVVAVGAYAVRALRW